MENTKGISLQIVLGDFSRASFIRSKGVRGFVFGHLTVMIIKKDIQKVMVNLIEENNQIYTVTDKTEKKTQRPRVDTSTKSNKKK